MLMFWQTMCRKVVHLRNHVRYETRRRYLSWVVCCVGIWIDGSCEIFVTNIIQMYCEPQKSFLERVEKRLSESFRYFRQML